MPNASADDRNELELPPRSVAELKRTVEGLLDALELSEDRLADARTAVKLLRARVLRLEAELRMRS